MSSQNGTFEAINAGYSDIRMLLRRSRASATRHTAQSSEECPECVSGRCTAVLEQSQSSEVDQWLCHNQLGNRTANSQNCLVLRCTRWGGVGALDHDAPGSSTYLHSE